MQKILRAGRATIFWSRQANEREMNRDADCSLLATALDNMCQGLLMFDSQARIVVCNGRYIRMYGLSEKVVKPGCTLSDLIRHRRKMGSFEGDCDAHCAEILRRVKGGRTTSVYTETPAGRTIHIVERAMADGGWVVTHEDVTEQRRAEARIAHMAHHDGLTDLPNRLLFHQRLEDALSWQSPGEQLAVLYIDLDNFKNSNDTLGHRVGDTLLRQVAKRLCECAGDLDTVARLGGDEFAIVQPKISGPAEAAGLATRIREALLTPFELSGHVIVSDASVGIAIAPTDGTDVDHLSKRADMALHAAKGGGRGRYRFFEPDMHARMTHRRQLEVDLRKALASGEFDVFYQPQVGLRSGIVEGCEALLRWKHPARGWIPPSDFIPVAEETGIITQIGAWVLRTACAEAARWPATVTVAVNISPVQFQHQTLEQVVVDALDAAGLPATRLEIEITERILMQESVQTLAALHRLRDRGVRIAMDDFGTGYSSLNYLRLFPFDKIKIDRSFVGDLSVRDNSPALVRAIVALAESFRMTTTAEGVETEQQRGLLEASGCTQMQGFLFSRPVPSADIRRLLDAEGGLSIRQPRHLSLAKARGHG